MVRNQRELIKNLSDKELLLNLYLTQAFLVIIALVVSRWWTGYWFAPLETISFSFYHVMVGLFFGVTVVLIEVVLYQKLPKSWFDDGGINYRMFSNRHPFHIFILSMVVAFCEELLFRGVLQTHFGLWVASFLFAIIHIRYLANTFLFTFTIVLSVSLGALYYYTENLLTVIIAHLTIDFLLGMLIRYGVLE